MCSFERCFQIMETGDPQLIDQWIANWSDLVEFEGYPIVTFRDAAARVAHLL